MRAANLTYRVALPAAPRSRWWLFINEQPQQIWDIFVAFVAHWVSGGQSAYVLPTNNSHFRNNTLILFSLPNGN